MVFSVLEGLHIRGLPWVAEGSPHDGGRLEEVKLMKRDPLEVQ